MIETRQRASRRAAAPTLRRVPRTYAASPAAPRRSEPALPAGRPAAYPLRQQSPALALRRRPARRRPRSKAEKPLLLVFLLALAFFGWRWWTRPSHSNPATSTASAAAPAVSNAPVASGNGASLAAPQPAAPAAPAALPAAKADSALLSAVQRLIDDDNGDTAIAVRNLRTGAGAVVNDHQTFPAASLAKVPILYEVFRQLDSGRLRRETSATILADDITDGAGVLQAREGDSLTVAELLDLAVSVSDNTAARILLREVGGVDAVDRTMADLGLNQTRLYGDSRPNTTSAADMASLLTMLAQRGGPLPVASGQSAAAPNPNTLAALLSLPQAQAWLSLGVPKGVTVAHKSGQLPGVRHDAAVVYAPRGPYVVVGLTANVDDQDEAEDFLAQLAKTTYEYFNQ